MKSVYKLTCILVTVFLLSACKKKIVSLTDQIKSKDTVTLQTNKKEDFIAGIYATQTDSDNLDECSISVKITQTQNGYYYFLKTTSKQLQGKATLSASESGEKYLTLEGIKWDSYEGDISQQQNDSLTESEPKELEIPVGIDASYVKDTLTIQNYGNAMNSYTKFSECGSKYIQLIKMNSKK